MLPAAPRAPHAPFTARQHASGRALAQTWFGPLAHQLTSPLHEPSVTAVSIPRPLPVGLGMALAAWAARGPGEFDRVVSAGQFDVSALTTGVAEPFRRWLSADLALLLDGFARLADTSRLRVCFGVVHHDQCRKFHVDQVRYRLVTTYLGPGTEWVAADAVRRGALGQPYESVEAANLAIVADPAAVRHAAPGDLLVMKGARHEHGRGAVHRSPPVEHLGALRVVLAVSPMEPG